MPRAARELALSTPEGRAKGVRPASRKQVNLNELSPSSAESWHQDSMSNWFVYIIEKKRKLCVGITTDLDNRMRQHRQVAPVYHEGPMSKAKALKRERTLKGWTREK